MNAALRFELDLLFQKGITQSDIAEKIGVSEALISKWINGAFEFSEEQRELFCTKYYWSLSKQALRQNIHFKITPNYFYYVLPFFEYDEVANDDDKNPQTLFSMDHNDKFIFSKSFEDVEELEKILRESGIKNHSFILKKWKRHSVAIFNELNTKGYIDDSGNITSKFTLNKPSLIDLNNDLKIYSKKIIDLLLNWESYRESKIRKLWKELIDKGFIFSGQVMKSDSMVSITPEYLIEAISVENDGYLELKEDLTSVQKIQKIVSEIFPIGVNKMSSLAKMPTVTEEEICSISTSDLKALAQKIWAYFNREGEFTDLLKEQLLKSEALSLNLSSEFRDIESDVIKLLYAGFIRGQKVYHLFKVNPLFSTFEFIKEIELRNKNISKYLDDRDELKNTISKIINDSKSELAEKADLEYVDMIDYINKSLNKYKESGLLTVSDETLGVFDIPYIHHDAVGGTRGRNHAFDYLYQKSFEIFDININRLECLHPEIFHPPLLVIPFMGDKMGRKQFRTIFFPKPVSFVVCNHDYNENLDVEPNGDLIGINYLGSNPEVKQDTKYFIHVYKPDIISEFNFAYLSIESASSDYYRVRETLDSVGTVFKKDEIEIWGEVICRVTKS